jgi:hypothetical protein
MKNSVNSGTSDSRHAFSDLVLARRLEGAEGEANAKWVEARARVSPAKGACWIGVGGARAMFDGVSSPATQTFGLGMFEPAGADVLRAIESFFEQRGATVDHEICPLAGVELAKLLVQRGYQPIEFSNVLYRPIGAGLDFASPPDERIRARPIGRGEEDLWAETTVKGWSDYPELTGFLLEMASVILQREGAISFLAEMEGKPIAAGSLCLSANVALLGGACTIPEARRRGAQLALLGARLSHAVGQGCDLAMMVAQPGSASQRNAERHGFRIAYTRTKWRLSRQPG